MGKPIFIETVYKMLTVYKLHEFKPLDRLRLQMAWGTITDA
jgi:hypothetical protein